MKPFRERNPLPIGIIGIAVILGMLVLAFNASSLPFLSRRRLSIQSRSRRLFGRQAYRSTCRAAQRSKRRCETSFGSISPPTMCASPA